MVSHSPARDASTVPPGRRVELIVVNGEGRLLGRLPTFEVGTPWWQDLEPIVARQPDLVVLRLLRTEERPGPRHGGRVSYLVEAERPPPGLIGLRESPKSTWSEEALDTLLADHHLRMPWARPGGPGADLAWATSHVRLAGAPRQVRSWNLSSIWALPTAAGTAWLKCVPPFFAHEAAAIEALSPSPHLPEVIAADGPRLLMAEMRGRDGYGAGPGEYATVISALLDLQSSALGRQSQVAGAIPHWTSAGMAHSATHVLNGRGQQLAELAGSGAVDRLNQLIDGWAGRWERVKDCGLPDVVFHGDLHPGNARIGADQPVIFDWGDSGWGHPLLDLGVVSAYHQDGGLATRVLDHWLEGWRRLVPGSDPHRAWELLGPVARMRAALVFQNFVDHIEPSERVYHDLDVPEALARTAASLGAG